MCVSLCFVESLLFRLLGLGLLGALGVVCCSGGLTQSLRKRSIISVWVRELVMWCSSKLRRIVCILGSVSVIVTALGLMAQPASAENAKAKPAHSTNKRYFFEFRARSAATYGHLYVLFGEVNGRGEIIKSDIAGLHPAGDANDCLNCSVVPWTLGHILFVPSETGASDGDLEEKYVSARYRVMADAATYKKVSAAIKKLKADNPMWNALFNNCVSFGNDIAERLDLKTPSFGWLEPKDYVESLRDLNGGKPQRALKFAAPSASKTKTSSATINVSADAASVLQKQK